MRPRHVFAPKQLLYFREIGKIDQKCRRILTKTVYWADAVHPSAIFRFPHCMDARQQISSCRKSSTTTSTYGFLVPVVSKHSACVGFCLWAICAKPKEAAKSCSISKVKSRRSMGQSPAWVILLLILVDGNQKSWFPPINRLVVDPCLSHYIHGFLIVIHPSVVGCLPDLLNHQQ